MTHIAVIDVFLQLWQSLLQRKSVKYYPNTCSYRPTRCLQYFPLHHRYTLPENALTPQSYCPSTLTVKPNAHRRRRRDEAVEFRRVDVVGVNWIRDVSRLSPTWNLEIEHVGNISTQFCRVQTPLRRELELQLRHHKTIYQNVFSFQSFRRRQCWVVENSVYTAGCDVTRQSRIDGVGGVNQS